MQTTLADFLIGSQDAQEAKSIIEKCVHCGFCTATCPTYQLLGDELDGPRGRIYLMKEVLEGNDVSQSTRRHLDRCLTCRNCESTCPSGVTYGRLVDIGRDIVERRLDQAGMRRPVKERIVRWALREGLTRPRLFAAAMKVGRIMRPGLPAALQRKIPISHLIEKVDSSLEASHERKMLFLEGCVQPTMSPNINLATARVLDQAGVELVGPRKAGCCGAVRFHTGDHEGGLDDMRRNIDAWWPHVTNGIDTLLINASGCGAMVKEYGHLLRHDPAYAARAKVISVIAKDLSEVLPEFIGTLTDGLMPALDRKAVAYHPPCTLQHGQRLKGAVEPLLAAFGIETRLCADSHLCCGSAGTYSVLQPELSVRLRDDKLQKLDSTGAETIASANIGCISHLQDGTEKPVVHWIELVDRVLRDGRRTTDRRDGSG